MELQYKLRECGIMSDSIAIIIWVLFATSPLILSAVFGSWHQRKCRKKTTEREQQFLSTKGGDVIHTIPKTIPERQINSCGLVMACLVVGPSWWQLFIGALKTIIGGRVKSYERILTWGKKEALQRLREQAVAEGWDDVINVRIDTAIILQVRQQDPGNKRGTLEIFAYGTGVK